MATIRILLTLISCFSFINLASAQNEPGIFSDHRDKKAWLVVDKVLRADRLLLKNGEHIQLIGLEAPELDRLTLRRLAGKPVEPHSVAPINLTVEEQSFLFSQKLLEGKKVRLEYDSQKKSDDWDNFAYVFLEDGTFVNTEILREGFANLRIRPPNMKYAEKLREAYREAKKEFKGFQGE